MPKVEYMDFIAEPFGFSNTSQAIFTDKWFNELESAHETKFYADMLKRTWPLPVISVMIYLWICTGLRAKMADRKPYKLKGILIAWNLMLSVFSTVGAYRTFFLALKFYNFHDSLCHADTTLPSSLVGVWEYIFTVSKLLEVGDTLLLVLRKKPLTFLHAFHHSTVMIFVWYAIGEQCMACTLYFTVNLFVHSIMYTYYLLKAIGVHLPRYVSISITSLQILQMVIGSYASIYGFVMHLRQVPCDLKFYTSLLYSCWYPAFFILFSNFFYQTYIAKRRSRKVE